MSIFIYKTIAALIIFLISLLTIIYPLRKLKTTHEIDHAESFELGEALASGIFLGAAFFHMLPESIQVFKQIYPQISYPIAEAICMSGFLLLLFLERLSLTNTLLNFKNTIPYMLALILIIHSLTEGAALGIENTQAASWMLFIAIIAHKSSDSFALCMVLMRYHFTLKQVILWIIFFSLMTPIGIGLGAMINSSTNYGLCLEATFNAFAAGTFIYIATLHHLRFHQRIEETQSLREFAMLTAGLVSMGVIALIV